VRFEHLAQAAEHTAQKLEAKATALSGTQPYADMSIVLFGSWARDELTEGSDDDWAVLVGRTFSAYDPEVVQVDPPAYGPLRLVDNARRARLYNRISEISTLSSAGGSLVIHSR
jgi:Nucleotidyltransferase domain